MCEHMPLPMQLQTVNGETPRTQPRNTTGARLKQDVGIALCSAVMSCVHGFGIAPCMALCNAIVASSEQKHANATVEACAANTTSIVPP